MKQPRTAAMTENLDPRPAAVSGADVPDSFWSKASSVKVHVKSFITMLKS